jgi:hypothetical protein
LKSGSTVLVDYTYLGQDTPVIAIYSSQPAVALTCLERGRAGGVAQVSNLLYRRFPIGKPFDPFTPCEDSNAVFTHGQKLSTMLKFLHASK